MPSFEPLALTAIDLLPSGALAFCALRVLRTGSFLPDTPLPPESAEAGTPLHYAYLVGRGAVALVAALLAAFLAIAILALVNIRYDINLTSVSIVGIAAMFLEGISFDFVLVWVGTRLMPPRYRRPACLAFSAVSVLISVSGLLYTAVKGEIDIGGYAGPPATVVGIALAWYALGLRPASRVSVPA